MALSIASLTPAVGENDGGVTVTARLLKVEKDAAESKKLAQLSMAFTIGIVAALALMKPK